MWRQVVAVFDDLAVGIVVRQVPLRAGGVEQRACRSQAVLGEVAQRAVGVVRQCLATGHVPCRACVARKFADERWKLPGHIVLTMVAVGVQHTDTESMRISVHLNLCRLAWIEC